MCGTRADSVLDTHFVGKGNIASSDYSYDAIPPPSSGSPATSAPPVHPKPVRHSAARFRRIEQKHSSNRLDDHFRHHARRLSPLTTGKQPLYGPHGFLSSRLRSIKLQRVRTVGNHGSKGNTLSQDHPSNGQRQRTGLHVFQRERSAIAGSGYITDIIIDRSLISVISRWYLCGIRSCLACVWIVGAET